MLSFIIYHFTASSMTIHCYHWWAGVGLLRSACLFHCKVVLAVLSVTRAQPIGVWLVRCWIMAMPRPLPVCAWYSLDVCLMRVGLMCACCVVWGFVWFVERYSFDGCCLMFHWGVIGVIDVSWMCLLDVHFLCEVWCPSLISDYILVFWFHVPLLNYTPFDSLFDLACAFVQFVAISSSVFRSAVDFSCCRLSCFAAIVIIPTSQTTISPMLMSDIHPSWRQHWNLVCFFAQNCSAFVDTDAFKL